MGEMVVERKATIQTHQMSAINATEFGCCSKVASVAAQRMKIDPIDTTKRNPIQKRERAEQKLDSLIGKISAEKGLSEKEIGEVVESAVHGGKVETAVQDIGLSNLMQLIIAIEKLGIAYRNQLKFCRREERDMQIKEMLATAENYKQQGKWARNFAIGACVAGLMAGALPIAGYLKGEWIVDKLSSLGNTKYLGWFKNLEQFRDKPMQLFKNLGTMSQSSVTSTQMMGQAQTAFGESERSLADKLGDMARTDGDEYTRTLQELLEDRRQYERFMEQVMQFEQNATSSLYR